MMLDMARHVLRVLATMRPAANLGGKGDAPTGNFASGDLTKPGDALRQAVLPAPSWRRPRRRQALPSMPHPDFRCPVSDEIAEQPLATSRGEIRNMHMGARYAVAVDTSVSQPCYRPKVISASNTDCKLPLASPHPPSVAVAEPSARLLIQQKI